MSGKKHALVTGASRGLGAEVSRQLAAVCGRISILSRDIDRLNQVADEIRRAGSYPSVHECDVRCPDSVRQAIHSAVLDNGEIDILINNAGIVEPVELICRTDPSAWVHHIQTNLIGPFNVLHYATVHLADLSVIINVSSGASTQPMKGRSAYCVGKAGLNMLSRIFALENENTSRRIYAFTPGPTDTDMHRIIRDASIKNLNVSNTPTLRSISDSARVLVWLCSQSAADITDWFIDGRDPKITQRALSSV